MTFQRSWVKTPQNLVIPAKISWKADSLLETVSTGSDQEMKDSRSKLTAT